MTISELVKEIDGSEYPFRLSKEQVEKAKQSGIVVVYGASDDLMEFEGFVWDERGAYEGAIAFIDKNGLLPVRECIEDDEVLKDYFKRIDDAKSIDALWCNGDGTVAWTYETDIPHETFKIMDDDEVYCVGIVFKIE